MAEGTPIGVYDILYPSPVPLKNLSAVAFSLELWRSKINEYRTSDTLREFDAFNVLPSLKTTLPDSPSAITLLIGKCMKNFARSMKDWLADHHPKVFQVYDHKNDILKYFNEFVADVDGAIHNVRTAEHMMRSDQLDEEVKFKIACMYCFEDDIRRIWPSVCGKMNVTLNQLRYEWDFNFNPNALLYYWIGNLRNELDQIPCFNDLTVSVDEKMHRVSAHWRIRSSIEYFWNRIPSENRSPLAVKYGNFGETFIRFILSRLDVQQLDEFVNEHDFHGSEFMRDTLLGLGVRGPFILPVWMYIRSVMNERAFTHLVRKILETRNYGKWAIYCCEIWNSSSDDLKRSAIRDILPDTKFFEYIVSFRYHDSDSTLWCLKFLLTMLSNATFTERSTFWHNTWIHLLPVTRAENLQRIMELCFENESEISEFKRNVMAGNENIRQRCVELLNDGYFDDLNDLVDFCYSETHSAINFKRELLQSTLFGRDSQISHEWVLETEKFHEFVCGAYHTADLLTDFKIRFESSSVFQNFIMTYFRNGTSIPLLRFKDFIVAFAPSEQNLQETKRLLIAALRFCLGFNTSILSYFCPSDRDEFLLWMWDNTMELEEIWRNYDLCE